jgi:hypothetical protein
MLETFLFKEDRIFPNIKVSSLHSCHNFLALVFSFKQLDIIRNQCIVSWASFLHINILFLKSFLDEAELASISLAPMLVPDLTNWLISGLLITSCLISLQKLIISIPNLAVLPQGQIVYLIQSLDY